MDESICARVCVYPCLITQRVFQNGAGWVARGGLRGRRRGRRLPWRRRARIWRRRRRRNDQSRSPPPTSAIPRPIWSTITHQQQQKHQKQLSGSQREINRHLENLTKEQPGFLSKGRTDRILVGRRQRATLLLTSPHLRELMKFAPDFFIYHFFREHPWWLVFNPIWNDNNR